MMAARDKNRHPLLVQAPLTVSPAVILPSGRDLLPFDYKPTPTTLPDTILKGLDGGVNNTENNAIPVSTPRSPSPSLDHPTQSPSGLIKYVHIGAGGSTGNGMAVHPTDVIRMCTTITTEQQKRETAAISDLDGWKAMLERKDLEEKRRIAPGWLDSNQQVLVPENVKNRRMEGGVGEGGGGPVGTMVDLVSLLETKMDNEKEKEKKNSGADLAAQLELAFGV